MVRHRHNKEMENNKNDDERLQGIAAEQQAAGTLAYDDNGEPVPNMYQVAYAGMTSAFEAMGGEWQRDETGRHWVYLLGESAAAGRR